MAIIYYPKNSLILRRDTVSASYEQILLSTYPNSILYFGDGSELEQISASNLPVTCSWSDNTVSASYAPFVGSAGTTLETGSLYPITSSWSEFSTTSSYALNAGSSGTTLETGSLYPITASWSTNAVNWNSSSILSLINNKQNIIPTGSTTPFTSSWAEKSISASYAPQINYSLNTGSLYPITSSWAQNWNSSSVISLINTKQNIIPTGSLIPITSSWSNSSSWAPTPTNVNSASYAPVEPSYSASVSTVKQNTLVVGGSYNITSSWATNIVNDNDTWLETGSLYPITSSWSTNAISASYAPGGSGTTLETGSTYPITASWAINSISGSSAFNFILLGDGSGSFYQLQTSDDGGIITLNVNQTPTAVTSSYPGYELSLISSSYTLTSSYALNVSSGGTTLETGSTYPITSSWAEWATNLLGSIESASYATTASLLIGSVESASYAPVEPAFSASISSIKQNTLVTGNSYSITSSWSVNATSASYAPFTDTNTWLETGSSYPITASWSENWNSSSVVSLINTKQNIIPTGSLTPFTSSWAINWNSSSIVSLIDTKQNNIATGSTVPFTSSWATNVVNDKMVTTGSTYPITSSWSTNAVNWNSSSLVSLVNTKQNIIPTGSLIPFTSSWALNAISASYAPQINYSLNTGSSYPITASWSVTSSFSNTASYALNAGSSGTTLGTGSTYPITSSWAEFASNLVGSITSASYAGTSSVLLGSIESATSSSYALTASYALNGGTGGGAEQLNTGSLYPITSSWAISSETASFISASIEFVGKTTGNFPVWIENILSATSSLYESGSNIGVNIANPQANLHINGNVLATSLTGSLQGTSSYANQSLSASYAPYVDTNTWLETGSLYPITASWAQTASAFIGNIISSSYAVSASYAPSAGGSGTSLETGSSYPITSSWSENVLNTANIYTLSDAATIETNTSLGNHFRVTLAGDRILGNPTNGTDGKKVIWELVQDNTGSRTISFASSWSFSPDLPETSIILSGTTGSRDFLFGLYKESSDKWDVVGFANGYDAPDDLVYEATQSYTLTNYDDGKMVLVNNTSSTIITLPNDLSSTFTCLLYQSGSGPIIVEGTGVKAKDNITASISQNSLISVIRLPDGEFVLGGGTKSKRIDVVSSSFVNPFTTDCFYGDHFRVMISDNFELSNPTNAYDGQRITWEFIQDAVGGYTCSFDDKFAFSVDLPTSSVVLNRTASKVDYLVAIYNEPRDKFDVVAYNSGF